MHDLVMLRDVEARYALRNKRLRYTVLCPLGAWLGAGVLRVLRARPVEAGDGGEELVELVLGYESYLPQ